MVKTGFLETGVLFNAFCWMFLNSDRDFHNHFSGEAEQVDGILSLSPKAYIKKLQFAQGYMRELFSTWLEIFVVHIFW